MPKEIFDQDRPRSTMARRLDEAFAGCEDWTLAPPTQRRSEAILDLRVSKLLADDRKGRSGARPGTGGALAPTHTRSTGGMRKKR